MKSKIYSVDDGHRIADRTVSEGVYRTQGHKDADRQQNGWELLRERLAVASTTSTRLYSRYALLSNSLW